MAIPDLPEHLYRSGREYYEQLKGLGLKPEACLWMFKGSQQNFVLTIVWSGIDKHGPYTLSKLIFEAYRKSALTREIDPFIVEVRSHQDIVGKSLISLPDQPHGTWWRIVDGNRKVDGDDGVVYQWQDSWVYHLQAKKRHTLKVSRDFERFRQNIAIAA